MDDKKTEKLLIRLSTAERDRLMKCARRKGSSMGAVLRALAEGWCDAVEEGRSVDLPLEVSSKEK